MVWIVPQKTLSRSEANTKDHSASTTTAADENDVQNLCTLTQTDTSAIMAEPVTEKKELEQELDEGEKRQKDIAKLKERPQTYLRKYQDLEIETMCLCTKIAGSENARFASELMKDAEANITKIDKVLKILTKVAVNVNEIKDDDFDKLIDAMKLIDEQESVINSWAIKFGFKENKNERGVKRKALW